MKYILPFIVSTIISYLMVPLCAKLSIKLGAIDIPKDERRMHKVPIPFGGGIAMFISFFITMFIFNELETTKLIGLFTGSFIILMLGYIDDIKDISAKLKLLVQIIVALIVVASGYKITHLTNFFSPNSLIDLGIFSWPLSVIWIVGVMNTINLVDGLDGLAAGLVTIATTTMLSIALILRSYDVVLICAILIGSCIGFLPRNFNPAKIFMGDAGAYFIGLILSVVTISGVLKLTATIAIFIPFLAIGLPIFDTFFAIVRRFLSGKPIMEADKKHLHHRFILLGFGQKRTVLAMYIINAILGIGAVALINGDFAYSFAFITIAIILMIAPINLTAYTYKEIEKEQEYGKITAGKKR